MNYTISNKRQLTFGQSLYLTGGIESLGLWDIFNENTRELKWNYPDIWTTNILLNPNQEIYYKFFVGPSKRNYANYGEVQWDSGPNRSLVLSREPKILERLNDPVLTVFDLNLRYDNSFDGNHGWGFRRNSIRRLIMDFKPDVFGIQEGLPHMIDYLYNSLQEEYDYYGKGRDSNLGGEQVGIFYRRDRFTLIHAETFWHSETPEVPGSIFNGMKLPRITSLCVFFRNFDKKSFVLMNSHYDHLDPSIRKRETDLNLKVLSRFCGYPIVIIGDLNAENQEQAVKEFLNQGFNDSYEVYNKGQKEEMYKGTFHGFEGGIKLPRIDYVFANSLFEVKRSLIMISEGKEMLSDHYPICSELLFKEI